MIIVTLDGESISGSPFTCNVYDVDKINITGLAPTAVGKPITFQGIFKVILLACIVMPSRSPLFRSLGPIIQNYFEEK